MQTRTLTLVLLFGLLIAAVAPVRFTMTPQSRLWIEGTSTVHDWTCEVSTFEGQLDALADALESVQAVQVRVPVKALDCKNGTMNKKAHRALKADTSPEVTYRLTSATPSGTAANGQFELETAGQLTIGGVTCPISMTVAGERDGVGRLRFKGQASVLMSSFGIDAPTAMLGALKTGDRVVVGFDVVLSR